jgi:hypothetical protein
VENAEEPISGAFPVYGRLSGMASVQLTGNAIPMSKSGAVEKHVILTNF